jgi:hypothetical protein
MIRLLSRSLLARPKALGLVCCCFALLAAGCSGPSEQDEIDELMQELGEDACFTIAPDVDFANRPKPYTSPRTYTRAGCYKGHVMDFHNPGSVEDADWFVETWWADDPPTTQAACESAWIGGYFAEWDGSTYVPFNMVSVHGLWWNGVCVGHEPMTHPPHVAPRDRDWAQLWGDGHDSCGDYRVVLSARTSQSTGAATRKLGLHYRANSIPPSSANCQ